MRSTRFGGRSDGERARTEQKVLFPLPSVVPVIIVLLLGAMMLAACGLSSTDADRSESDSLLLTDVGDASVPPLFVAVGNGAYTSVDGVRWNSQSISIENEAIVFYGEGRSVIVGLDGRLITSVSGSRWNEISRTNADLHGTKAVAYGQGGFVAVGEAFADRLVATAATSTDGVDWTPRDATHLFGGLQSVTYGEGAFVAVGSGFAATSSDGTEWIESPHRFLKQLHDVAYGAGSFVTVGGRGSVFVSADGVVWEEGVSGLSDVFVLRAVTYGGSRFVAVGDEQVDGGTFVPGEGYGDDRPMNRSVIISSRDGVNWEVDYTGPSQTLSDIVYGDGMFVAIGENQGPTDQWGKPTSYNAVVLTSENGTDWTMTEVGGPSVLNEEAGYYQSSPDNPSVWLSSVTYWPASDGS